jgi:hypothetical protein
MWLSKILIANHVPFVPNVFRVPSVSYKHENLVFTQ